MSPGFNIKDFVDDDMAEAEIDRCEFWVTANREVRKTGKPNCREARIQVNSNWNFEYLEKALVDFPDKNEILGFFKFGWPLNASDTAEQTKLPRNQKGACSNADAIGKFINKEINRGSIIGPFKKNPFGKSSRFSPLDTRPKKDSDDLRVIINLSHPFKSGSVNHSIDKDQFLGEPIKLTYPTVEDLAKLVVLKGRGCLIFKRDLEAAYFQMKLDAGDIHLLGFMFDNKFYFFVTLSMGSRSSCYCCQKTTDIISYIAAGDGNEIVNYLDDLGGAEAPDLAKEAFENLAKIINNIGIRESPKKAVEPNTRVSFLGILIDSIELTLRITPDRLIEIKTLIESWLKKDKARLVELQSLLGKLNFACSTIRAGRVFVSRIINLLKEVKPNQEIELSLEFKKDLNWWNKFMSTFDGVSLIPDYNWSCPDVVISTDSCLVSCGGWNENRREFWHLKFPGKFNNRGDVNINEKEAMAVMVGLKLWGTEIKDSNVLLHCDNQCTVDIVNKGKATNPFAQNLLREICYISAKFNAWVKVVFKPGVNNRVADFCSRIDLDDSFRDKLLEEVGEPLTERYAFPGLLEVETDW